MILNSLIPSPALQRLLRSPFYQDKLTYLAGSPLNLNDLERSKAGNANAIFLMCSTNLTSGEHSRSIEKLTAEHCHSVSENELKDAKIADAETITMILSVKNSFPSLPLFAETTTTLFVIFFIGLLKCMIFVVKNWHRRVEPIVLFAFRKVKCQFLLVRR